MLGQLSNKITITVLCVLATLAIGLAITVAGGDASADKPPPPGPPPEVEAEEPPEPPEDIPFNPETDTKHHEDGSESKELR